MSAPSVAVAESSPGGGDVAGACDIGTLDRLKEANKGGLFLLIAQTGCGDCAEMEKVMEETVGERKPIVKADLAEDKGCLTLAEQVGAVVTPTVVYYEAGSEVARLAPDGVQTWDDFRGKLRELATRTLTASVAPQSLPTP